MDNTSKELVTALIVLIMGIGIALASLFGYVSNLVEFFKLDFEKPLKAEIIRGSGVIFPVIGIVAGYVDIQD